MSSFSTSKNVEPMIFDSEVLSSKLQLCMLYGNASTSPKFMKHVNFSNQRNTCDSATRAKEGEQMRLFALRSTLAVTVVAHGGEQPRCEGQFEAVPKKAEQSVAFVLLL